MLVKKTAQANLDPKVVAAVLRALNKMNAATGEALATFEKYLEHPQSEVNLAAALALVRLAPERLDLQRLVDLRGRLDDLKGQPYAELSADAEKLWRQKLSSSTAKDLPALQKGLKSPIIKDRLAYLQAIGLLKEQASDAVPDLAGLLSTADDSLALEVLRILKDIGPAARKAVPEMVEFARKSKDRNLALESVLVLCKLEPSHPYLTINGFTLLIDGLQPDTKKLKAFVAQPLDNPSAQAIRDIGAPAVDLLVKGVLDAKNPINIENKGVKPTAMRYAAYALLVEFTKKAGRDEKLTQALRAQIGVLKILRKEEVELANLRTKETFYSDEEKELYEKTSQVARRAYSDILGLSAP